MRSFSHISRFSNSTGLNAFATIGVFNNDASIEKPLVHFTWNSNWYGFGFWSDAKVRDWMDNSTLAATPPNSLCLNSHIRWWLVVNSYHWDYLLFSLRFWSHLIFKDCAELTKVQIIHNHAQPSYPTGKPSALNKHNFPTSPLNGLETRALD